MKLKMKKRIAACLIILALVPMGIGAEEDDDLPIPSYDSLPGFAFPDEFYTVHRYFPGIYLNSYRVEDTARKLTVSEKRAAALLVVSAEHATYEKFHQSCGIHFDSPLMRLLKNNFAGLDKVEATHDVNPGQMPIRDVGAFFRKWLDDELSEELQQQRIEKSRSE